VEKPPEILEARQSLERKNKHKPKNPRYDKNIGGYILKKVVREFIGERYASKVNQLCMSNFCSVT
jgi:hypothetical protein